MRAALLFAARSDTLVQPSSESGKTASDLLSPEEQRMAPLFLGRRETLSAVASEGLGAASIGPSPEVGGVVVSASLSSLRGWSPLPGDADMNHSITSRRIVVEDHPHVPCTLVPVDPNFGHSHPHPRFPGWAPEVSGGRERLLSFVSASLPAG